jgi:hypothetical protein
MDIPDKGKEICIFVAEYGFVSVFEEMAASMMTAIEILGIPCQEFSHDLGYALLAALKQDVYVIAQEDPGVDGAFALSDIVAEAFQEKGSVLVVIEDGRFVDAPHHDMMQGTGNIQSGLSRHELAYRTIHNLSSVLHS